MRNLTLAKSSTAAFPVSAGYRATATALDLDENALYVVFESQNTDDAEVNVEVWKQAFDPDRPCEVEQKFMFTSACAPAGLPVKSQLVSLRVSPETRKLVAIMAGGDLTTIPIDEDEPIDVEGSVECGILAASWSPDDSLLVLVTAEDKVILMTSMFDVLSEGPLRPSDFGEDKYVNVGWGSKSTQFHGSLGKEAAKATPTTDPGSSPDDDQIPRISWRGDGAYFAVSSLSSTSSSTRNHRVMRVYDRQGLLQSTSEPVAGLEHSLAWSPSGSLIASTQRFGFEGGGAGKESRHDVVFFERNGLRHGEFGLRHDALMTSVVDEKTKRTKREEGEGKDLRWGYKVKDVSWSPDSEVLAVWVEEGLDHVVQLWVIGNYHWYLKQEIRPSQISPGSDRFTSVGWHPEHPLHLIITTNTSTIIRAYSWDTCSSPSTSPHDSGSVAVADGATILLTAFRRQNVPPPMCSHKLVLPTLDGAPSHLSFWSSQGKEILVVSYESRKVIAYDLQVKALQPTPGVKTSTKIMDPVVRWNQVLSGVDLVGLRQTLLIDGTLYALFGSANGDGNDELVSVDIEHPSTSSRLSLPGKNGRLTPSSGARPLWQSSEGIVHEVDPTTNSITVLAKFPKFCLSFVQSGTSLIGLSRTGHLYSLDAGSTSLDVGSTAAGDVPESRPVTVTLAQNCNSFTVTQHFLIYTTTAHEATFIPLSELHSAGSDSTTVWERRRVERGSRIVTTVPTSMALVLQMPRGNLETINPRALVMKVVLEDLDAGQYGKAFLSCRKYRIDLNTIVEHDYDRFLVDVSAFVEQVAEPDYINLLLAAIGRGKQPADKIGKVCDAIRLELEKRDVTKYVSSILTAYAVKTPPEYEAGLSVLLRLRKDHPDLVEDAVKYIIFLVDANTLFDIALGMYDFSLVLMIAQYAQKDPREYLPFLRELRALEPHYQHFRINDHLKRHAKALESIAQAGPERFDEAIAYVELHHLFDDALRVWHGTDKYKDALILKGNWLFERRDFRQAAIVFLEAKDIPKGMVALERALDWQSLFDLAISQNTSTEELEEMAYRVSDDLTSKKRHAEAGRVLLDYTKDTRATVLALVSGNLFSEARRIISLRSTPELLEEIVHPGTLESCSQVHEDLHEMREQLRKQMNRISELRIKKIEEPDAFYGQEETTLHNVDVMTDASMPATAFTRYTAAPSNTSKTTKRSSRSKRKLALKEGAGRKGTVHEEEYLLNSITKLTARFDQTRDETSNLLFQLLQFTEEHRKAAVALQGAVSELEKELEAALEVAWAKSPDPEPATSEPLDTPIQLPNPVDKVPKAVLANGDWRVTLVDSSLI